MSGAFRPLATARSEGYRSLLHRCADTAAPVELALDGLADVATPCEEPPAAEAPVEYSAGETELINEALAEIESTRQEAERARDEARQLLDEARTLRRQTLLQAAADVGELVVALTRRVVGASMALHPDAIPALIHDAVARLPADQPYQIAVPVDRVDTVREQLSDEMASRVVGDAELCDGCRVRTAHTSLDMALPVLMAGVDAAVQDWLAEQ